jgi:hypothetical protein
MSSRSIRTPIRTPFLFLMRFTHKEIMILGTVKFCLLISAQTYQCEIRVSKLTGQSLTSTDRSDFSLIHLLEGQGEDSN